MVIASVPLFAKRALTRLTVKVKPDAGEPASNPFAGFRLKDIQRESPLSDGASPQLTESSVVFALVGTGSEIFSSAIKFVWNGSPSRAFIAVRLHCGRPGG
jgi:hypothetical protein